MLEKIKKFNREVSIERFISHSSNSLAEIGTRDDLPPLGKNSWTCGILWGNAELSSLFIIKFTTLNILAMSPEVFESTDDSMLFEYTKDFMKEYCNFYAGFIKGTFNNNKIDISLSLPIVSNSLCPTACLGGEENTFDADNWIIKSNRSYFEIESYIKVHESFKKHDLSFLESSPIKMDAAAKTSGGIEFF